MIYGANDFFTDEQIQRMIAVSNPSALVAGSNSPCVIAFGGSDAAGSSWNSINPAVAVGSFIANGGEILKISSASLNDGPAGKGLQSIKFYGWDASGAWINDTVITAGITPVAFSKAFASIYFPATEIVSTGIDGTNAGILRLQNATAGIIGGASATYSSFNTAAFKVPPGHTFQIVKVIFEKDTTLAGTLGRVRYQLGGTGEWQILGPSPVVMGIGQTEFRPLPVVMPANTNIDAQTIGPGGIGNPLMGATVYGLLYKS